YISIDFQLYVLLVGLLWLFQSRAPAAVGLLAVASLFYFNRMPVWDDWALYFFAAYAMGALAYWASKRENPLPLLVFMATVVVPALTLDFRPRIAVALATAILLGLAYQRIRLPAAWTLRLNFLGDISYSVFLIHYPVCLLLNAIFGSVFPGDPAANAFGLFLAWGLSLMAGALFHRYVEAPAGRWLGCRAKRASASV
ncbi:MAG: acyltransferase, partial [Rhodocyclaceae bacterium]|nr:acyltransferase [Rhodocyclaceae bacterium]